MRWFKVVNIVDGMTREVSAITPIEAIRLVVGRVYFKNSFTVWGFHTVTVGDYEVAF
jgi:hypothetical protein